MTEFTIQIAGHPVGVCAGFASTRDYCRNYLTGDAPVFSITVTPEDLSTQQRLLDEEAEREGFRRRKFTEPFLERTAIQYGIAGFLFSQNILLLHGSALTVDGRGYLFMAKSGTGKSTHTRFWREMLGERCRMVNDDKPFVEIAENGILLHGSPWSGKHGLDSNISVPLRGICFLRRGVENRIGSMEAEEALPFLLHEAQSPDLPGREETFHSLVWKLSKTVPLYQMTCTKTPGAARVAFEAMHG